MKIKSEYPGIFRKLGIFLNIILCIILNVPREPLLKNRGWSLFRSGCRCFPDRNPIRITIRKFRDPVREFFLGDDPYSALGMPTLKFIKLIFGLQSI